MNANLPLARATTTIERDFDRRLRVERSAIKWHGICDWAANVNLGSLLNTDITIDTGVPIGDVMIDLPGLEAKVGPGSSVANLVVANPLSLEVAWIMMAKGIKPLVVPNPAVTPNAEEIERELVKEFRRRIGAHL